MQYPFDKGAVMAREDIVEYYQERLGQNIDGAKEQAAVCCPFHDDRTPSLSINLDTGLWKCHAGCGHGNLPQFEDRCMGAGLGEPILAPKTNAETVYSYQDANGIERYQIVRSDSGAGKTFIARRRNADGTFQKGVGNAQRVLYHLPEVLKADLVVICEGEKCVDAVRNLSLSEVAGCAVASTCNPFGAEKWSQTFNSYFKGKRVVILPDNDAPGRRHAENVASALQSHAAEIKVIDLPELGQGEDVYEFIAAREQSAAVQLWDLIEKSGSYNANGGSGSGQARPVLLDIKGLMSQCDEQLDWLLDGQLLAVGLSIMGAKPKVGKSTLARQFALCVARGEPFLGRETKQGPVILVSLEDGIQIVGDHLRRLRVRESDPISIIPDRPTEEVLRSCIEKKRPVLVIIDSLARYAGIDVDRYDEVTRVFARLQKIAKDYGTHILVVHHLGKKERLDAFDGFIGSTAIFGGVDTAILLKRDKSTRTIETRCRKGHDIPESILNFDPDNGRTTLGSDVEAISAGNREKKKMDRRLAILGFLESNPGSIENQIFDAVGGKSTTFRNDLSKLVEQGSVRRSGQGQKGDPYRYSCSPIPVEGRVCPPVLELPEPIAV